MHDGHDQQEIDFDCVDITEKELSNAKLIFNGVPPDLFDERQRVRAGNDACSEAGD